MHSLTAHPKWPELQAILSELGSAVVAVSGGVDSLLLATLTHHVLPGRMVAAHATSPAVQDECTARVRAEAHRQGWRTVEIETGEFTDESYLSNPFDRCYFCKTHLYAKLTALAQSLTAALGTTPVVLSGANTDDLGEHRPGLTAAREHGVRHPFVEAAISKSDIRAIACKLSLPFALIPASPCLASRIYTGTRVTPQALAAVAAGEKYLKRHLNIDIVRCRVRETVMLVETTAEAQHLLTQNVLAELERLVTGIFPAVRSARLDPQAYRPGRAFNKEQA